MRIFVLFDSTSTAIKRLKRVQFGPRKSQLWLMLLMMMVAATAGVEAMGIMTEMFVLLQGMFLCLHSLCERERVSVRVWVHLCVLVCVRVSVCGLKREKEKEWNLLTRRRSLVSESAWIMMRLDEIKPCCACLCACSWMSAHARVCVCVCVCEGGREREREKEREGYVSVWLCINPEKDGGALRPRWRRFSTKPTSK